MPRIELGRVLGVEGEKAAPEGPSRVPNGASPFDQSQWTHPSMTTVYHAYIEGAGTIQSLELLVKWLLAPGGARVRFGEFDEPSEWLTTGNAESNLRALFNRLSEGLVWPKGQTHGSPELLPDLPMSVSTTCQFTVFIPGVELRNVFNNGLEHSADPRLRDVVEKMSTKPIPQTATVVVDWRGLSNGEDSLLSLSVTFWGQPPASTLLNPYPKDLAGSDATWGSLPTTQLVDLLFEAFNKLYETAFSRLVIGSGLGVATAAQAREDPLLLYPSFNYGANRVGPTPLSIDQFASQPELAFLSFEVLGPGRLSAGRIRGKWLVFRRSQLIQLAKDKPDVVQAKALYLPVVDVSRSRELLENFERALINISGSMAYTEFWFHNELSGDLRLLERIADELKTAGSRDLEALRMRVQRVKDMMHHESLIAIEQLDSLSVDDLPGFQGVVDAIVRNSPLSERRHSSAARIEERFLIAQDAQRVKTGEDTELAVLYLIFAEIWVAVALAMVEEVGGPGPIPLLSKAVGVKLLIGLVPSILIAVWFLLATRRGAQTAYQRKTDESSSTQGSEPQEAEGIPNPSTQQITSGSPAQPKSSGR